MRRLSKKLIAIIVLAIILIAVIAVLIVQVKHSSEIDEKALLKPKSISFDRSLNKDKLNQMIRAARLYYTYWNTGEYKYLNAAISPSFSIRYQDQPQDYHSLILKYYNLRRAIPDLHCSIDDLLISGNKMTALLTLSGNSKGEFMGSPATGKPVQFRAIDILLIQNGRIVEDWHLEDKLSLLEQLKVIKILQE